MRNIQILYSNILHNYIVLLHKYNSFVIVKIDDNYFILSWVKFSPTIVVYHIKSELQPCKKRKLKLDIITKFFYTTIEPRELL